MPPIRSQHVDASGIQIVASDGREVTITPRQLLDAFDDAEAGGRRPVDARKDLRANIDGAKADASARVARYIEGQLEIPAERITITFNADDGAPTGLVLG